MSGLKDRRFVQRIARGDAEALGDLYDSQARLLAFRLRREGASVEEAEDVLQETFLDVWRTANSYRGEAEVAGWLWGIASRRYLMLVRGELRLRRREAQSSAGSELSSDDDQTWALSVDARGVLDRLSPDLREAFTAVAIEGLSVAEAAEHLRAPEGTIKSRVHRARSALRRELQ